MSKQNPTLKEDVIQALENQQDDYACWLIENALELDPHNSIATNLFYKITESSIKRASENAKRQIKQVIHILNCPGSLVEDEMLLLISNLSSAYCVERLSERLGIEIEPMPINSAIELLDECTSGFSDPKFRAALSAARRHFPNPLPEPLAYKRDPRRKSR
jgi:hypothetical protein